MYDTSFAALAHRGGAKLPANVGIENTLAAFRHAVDLGYRYLETDAQCTKDGVLVAMHDSNLKRVAGIDRRISDLTFDELRDVRIGGREPIPSLEELVTTFPDARFNIDMKAPATVEPLAAFVAAHKLDERVCVVSFQQRSLWRFRRLSPTTQTACGPVEVAAALAPGARRSLHRPIVQMPRSITWRGRRVPLLSPQRVQAIHRLGGLVHIWTVDAEAELDQLLEWRVDGIFTDRPDLLKTVMQRRGMWSTD